MREKMPKSGFTVSFKTVTTARTLVEYERAEVRKFFPSWSAETQIKTKYVSLPNVEVWSAWDSNSMFGYNMECID
jgi:hypothetical protein